MVVFCASRLVFLKQKQGISISYFTGYKVLLHKCERTLLCLYCSTCLIIVTDSHSDIHNCQTYVWLLSHAQILRWIWSAQCIYSQTGFFPKIFLPKATREGFDSQVLFLELEFEYFLGLLLKFYPYSSIRR